MTQVYHERATAMKAMAAAGEHHDEPEDAAEVAAEPIALTQVSEDPDATEDSEEDSKPKHKKDKKKHHKKKKSKHSDE